MSPQALNVIRLQALFGLVSLLLISIGHSLAGWLGSGVALVLAIALIYLCWFVSDRHLLKAYSATPLHRKQAPTLHRLVQRLCKSAEMPQPRLYSIASPAANAFSVGRDRHRASLVVTQGLLKLLEEDELEGIVAHELSHIYRQDSLSQTAVAVLAEILSWPGRVMFFHNHIPSGNPLGALLALLFAPLTAFFVHIGLGQSRDLAADRSAARLTRNPRALARALEKLDERVKRQPLLFNPAHQGSLTLLGATDNIFANLFATHPAVRDRLEQLDLISKEMIRREGDSAIRAMQLD